VRFCDNDEKNKASAEKIIGYLGKLLLILGYCSMQSHTYSDLEVDFGYIFILGHCSVCNFRIKSELKIKIKSWE